MQGVDGAGCGPTGSVTVGIYDGFTVDIGSRPGDEVLLSATRARAWIFRLRLGHPAAGEEDEVGSFRL